MWPAYCPRWSEGCIKSRKDRSSNRICSSSSVRSHRMLLLEKSGIASESSMGSYYRPQALKSHRSWCEFWLYHSLADWPCKSYLISLNLSFFIWKVEIRLTTSVGCCRIRWAHECECLTMPGTQQNGKIGRCKWSEMRPESLKKVNVNREAACYVTSEQAWQVQKPNLNLGKMIDY